MNLYTDKKTAEKPLIRVLVSGAAGKMGMAIIRELHLDNQFKLVGALEHISSCAIGQNSGQLAGIGNNSVLVGSGLYDKEFDVMIDFSRPDGIKHHLDLCIKQKAAIVIGTTGLNENHNRMLFAAADNIPVLYSANTSIGINLCAALIKTASRVLGEHVDIEIVEAHHRQKVDAPSGTALLLGKAAAKGQGLPFPDCGVFSREGVTGTRESATIGFSTIRGGDIAGEHTVMFIGESERIEIVHRATDRKIFARGAAHAAKWIVNKEVGLYSMQDMLQLEE